MMVFHRSSEWSHNHKNKNHASLVTPNAIVQNYLCSGRSTKNICILFNIILFLLIFYSTPDQSTLVCQRTYGNKPTSILSMQSNAQKMSLICLQSILCIQPNNKAPKEINKVKYLAFHEEQPHTSTITPKIQASTSYIDYYLNMTPKFQMTSQPNDLNLEMDYSNNIFCDQIKN